MNLTKFLSYSECLQHIEKNIKLFKDLYITKDLTARKVAENQNIFYDQNFQKALLRVCGNKGLGLGGKRQGLGNKKGTFCMQCMKLKPCNCK